MIKLKKRESFRLIKLMEEKFKDILIYFIEIDFLTNQKLKNNHITKFNSIVITLKLILSVIKWQKDIVKRW